MPALRLSSRLDKVIPPIPAPATTKYIKHERIQSERLTKFWGRPMHLGAHVLLPEGFDAHPDARYPLVIFHGHHPQTIAGFREEPPDPDLKPEYSERFHLPALQPDQQEHAHQFYKEWTGPDYPRMVIIEIQHANPYYDDSYAVNSANLGPYGDAITYELIPYLEKKYRCLGRRLGPVPVRRLDRRLGGWRPRSSIPRNTTAAVPPAPTRSTSGPTPWSTSTRTRTPITWTGPWQKVQAARRAQLPRAHLHDARGHEPPRAGAGHQEPLGTAVGHLGGRLFARRARRLPQADLGQAYRSVNAMSFSLAQSSAPISL